MTEQNAYQALRRIASLSLANAQQLPAQIDSVQQWSGIGFSVLGVDFVIPMSELAEMLEIPAYTRLPGVRSWVRGVANVRGRLLPLFDLAGFYEGTLSGQKKHQRLLVVDKESIYAGLWVDRVYGMQYFDIDTKKTKGEEALPEHMQQYVDGCYELNGRTWWVFCSQVLCQDDGFLNVAVT